MSPVRLSQNADRAVSTIPLPGISESITTSNAEMRSLVTMRSWLPRSYISRTLPRLKGGRSSSVLPTGAGAGAPVKNGWSFTAINSPATCSAISAIGLCLGGGLATDRAASAGAHGLATGWGSAVAARGLRQAQARKRRVDLAQVVLGIEERRDLVGRQELLDARIGGQGGAEVTRVGPGLLGVALD